MTTQTLNPELCQPAIPHEAVRRTPLPSRILKFKQFGQRKPGIAAPHPDKPGIFEVTAGIIDCQICSIVQTDFAAIVHDEPFSRRDATRLQLIDGLDDGSSDPFYIAELLIRFKNASDLRTWTEVARELDRTASTITGYRSVGRCPPLLKPRLEGLSPSIVRRICGIKNRHGMEQAIEFAHTPISGRKPTSREVGDFIREISASHRQPRPRSVSFTFNEMPMTFCIQEGDSVGNLSTQLFELASKLNLVSKPDENALSVLKRNFSIKHHRKPRRGF